MKAPEQCENCSKLTIKTPERRQERHSIVFIVNLKQILYIVLVLMSAADIVWWEVISFKIYK